MNRPTLLAVDDQPHALILLQRLLEPDGYRVITATDGTTAAALARRERPDIVLLDVMMPGIDGFEVCRQLRADPELATVPILLLTALDDRDSRLRGLEAGADDFLSKPVNAAELRVRVRTITSLNRYRRLYEESSRFEAAIAHSGEGIVLAETDGTIVLRNEAFLRLLQPAHRTQPDLFGHFPAEDAARLRAALAGLRPDGPAPTLECGLIFGHVESTRVEVTPSLVPWERRTILQLHLHDMTEKKQLEAQLLRSQRIELIGQLSSGIVHDVHNLLTAISSSASLLQFDPTGPKSAQHFANIQQAVQRSAALLRQLLHFGRGSDGPLELLDAAHVVREVTDLVRQSFGGAYDVTLALPTESAGIRADPTQLHQIVMNLCVNARDAMPDGGPLALALEIRTVPPAEALAAGVEHPVARYLVISVRDHGTGIPPAVQARLFDPFFTTKPPGKGTGLGLATVLRLMKRHQGFVRLETEVGRGSCFHCFFPLAD